jgi:hypothetical protein
VKHNSRSCWGWFDDNALVMQKLGFFKESKIRTTLYLACHVAWSSRLVCWRLAGRTGEH